IHPPIPDIIRASGTVSAQSLSTGTPPDSTSTSFSTKTGSQTVVNLSFGGEVEPLPKIVFRAGAFTDFDAIEDTTNGNPNRRLDWFGATFGVGHKTSPLGATYGVVYRYGRGTLAKQDDLGGQPDKYVLIDYRAHGLMAVLSATFEIGGAVDAFARRFRSPFAK